MQVWSVCGSSTTHFPRFQWEEPCSLRSGSQFQHSTMWTWRGRRGERLCRQHCAEEPLLAAASLSALHATQHCQSGVCWTHNQPELFSLIVVKINLFYFFFNHTEVSTILVVLFAWLVTQRENKEKTAIQKRSFLVIGLDARLIALLCKEIIVAKSKEVKTGWWRWRWWWHQQEQWQRWQCGDEGESNKKALPYDEQ